MVLNIIYEYAGVKDEFSSLCGISSGIVLKTEMYKLSCLYFYWKHFGRWWAARSSKPVGGMRNLPGGFDSHVLPPLNLHYYAAAAVISG